MNFLSEEAQETLGEFGEKVAEELAAMVCSGATMALEAGPEAIERIMGVSECLAYL